jgi:hypothetical protein
VIPVSKPAPTPERPSAELERAIASARRELGFGPEVDARAWFVTRIDETPASDYILVVLGEEGAAVAAAAVTRDRTRVAVSVRLPGTGPYPHIDERRARELLALDEEATLEMVWRPSKVTRSPLHTLWMGCGPGGVAYVDMLGRCWRRL